MGRTVDHLAGLAVLGVATAGPLSFSVPDLLLPDVPTAPQGADATGRTLVRSGPPRRPGERRLSLVQGPRSIELEYPVPVPEVSGVGGSAHEAAPRVWVVHAPLPEEALVALGQARPELVVLANARDLLRAGEPFVQAIHELRAGLGSAPLLWAPRAALPHRLAFLVYAGVDLLDTTEGEMLAADGSFLDPTLGTMEADPRQRSERCGCLSCRTDPPGPLAVHTRSVYAEEMRLVRAAAAQGRLRELVEARLTAEPLLAELLRYADRHLFRLLEERIPVVDPARRTYVLTESFRRPEVRRFRERFIERYRPPPSKEVLLLVPCSRTKPYRASRSHRRFARALEGAAPLERLHVVSVTSPLGLVPRDLEDIYPAKQYDIPVTGEWNEAERAAVVEALVHLLRVGSYREVVVHLDPAEYEFLKPALASDRPVRWTMTDDRSTSPEALSRLGEAVAGSLRAGRGAVPGGPLQVVREELERIAAFQFGPEAARRLFGEPTRLAGRPWFQRVTDGRSTDLATWREERGLFQLTVAGGQRMLADGPLTVEVADGLRLAGDLFTPGVVRSDPAIRVADAVLLVRRGELLGVGEAELPGPMMTQMPHGVAVHVRHRAHGEVARPAPEAVGSTVAARDGPVV